MVETAERRRVVTKIPADAGKSSRIEFGKRMKVAAYCRVSTDDEDQLNSYRVQKDYYTRYIANNEKWDFVDVYADEGITGTQVKKRDEFLRMIKDCEKGKIDMILTKSVSRFARNIVDSLSFVRKLKAMGIAIYFEEQNINSLKEDSETYIGIYSVMAQSESENISANVKWGISKRMENGTYCSNMTMFGYRRDKITKEITIVESEAEVIRWIFNLYLDGKSAFQIKQWLEENNIKTYTGKSTWQTTSIHAILQNEKYCGDVMYQKTYCVDCLTKKKKMNNGQKTKYLVVNDHPAIIPRDIFKAAMSEFARRNALRSKSDNTISCRGRYSAKYVLSELLICEECGSHFRRKTNKKKDGVHHYWRCISRLDYKDKYCDFSTGLEEKNLQAAICRAISRVLQGREDGYELLKSKLIYATSDVDTDELYLVEKGIHDEQIRIEELADLAIQSKCNKDKYTEAIADCSQRIKDLRERRDMLMTQIKCNEKAREELERIENYTKQLKPVMTEFDDAIIHRIVNSIQVTKDLNLRIFIKGGAEIVEPLFPPEEESA
ncbi:MAG: recombinase family protein [Acutalibacteraceae bacterium]|nr:recombinase family protein [Acutalibacteraceae bacterium]